MANDPVGGRTENQEVQHKMESVPKCSLISVAIPGTRKTKIFEAKNINEFVGHIPQKYTVDLRKTNGESVKEKIEITTFNDLNLKEITNKSEVLKGQAIEQDFLYKFLEEWKKNPSFKHQFLETLKDETRKQQLIVGLRNISAAMKDNQSPNGLMNFLKNL